MSPVGSRPQDRIRNARDLVEEIPVEDKGQRSQRQRECSDHPEGLTPVKGQGRGRRTTTESQTAMQL